MTASPTQPTFNRRRLGRAFSSLATAALVVLGTSLVSSEGLAQPTKRDSPLKTPAPAGAPKLVKPGAGRLGRPAAGPTKRPTAGGATPKAGAAGGAAGPGGPATAGGKIGAAPDIEFRPVAPGKRVAFNMEDVDLPDLVKAISKMTGRRFIFGGKVRQIKATIEAPTKVTVGEAYQAFLSVLETNGMTVIPMGRYLKIVESGGVATQTTPVLGTGEPVPNVDRYITRLYRLKHVDAATASNVLGKFKSKDADITIYEPTNLLIITDTGSNIRRLLRITEEIDSGGAGEQIYMQPIHNSNAADLATQLNEMLDIGPGGGGRAKILADERNNTLVMVATEDDYKRMLEIIKKVDAAGEGGDGGGIHVLPLQHARCDELQTTLSGILGSGTGASPAARAGGAARGRTDAPRRATGGTATASGDGGVFEGEVRVHCDEATNSLVTTSSLRDYAALRNVIDKLDQPRRQVFLEAVIMDVNIDHARDLGLGYHGGGTSDLGGGGDTLFYGGNNAQQSITGFPASLEALAFGVRGPDLDGTDQLLGTGLSIPAFGVVLHALATSGDSNVLATPHILATDNIPAEITIGQNIALQTGLGGGLGQLAQQAGAGAGGLGGLGALGALGFNAPREDVGIKLKITPHINDSDQVRMEINEEFSGAGAPQGAVEAIPINKRTADTTVIVRDQQTVVIGGLMREDHINAETKIPVLGDIPVLGILFRSTRKQKLKNNLLLILTPHIIREQNDLRRIFERKMQERQEFLERYFVFDELLPWTPAPDYSRTNGLLEHIRQTQLAIADRKRLHDELAPEATRKHEPVKPVQMPSSAGSGQTKQPVRGGAARKPAPAPRRGRRTTKPAPNRSKFRVPGGATPKRYRVE